MSESRYDPTGGAICCASRLCPSHQTPARATKSARHRLQRSWPGCADSVTATKLTKGYCRCRSIHSRSHSARRSHRHALLMHTADAAVGHANCSFVASAELPADTRPYFCCLLRVVWCMLRCPKACMRNSGIRWCRCELWRRWDRAKHGAPIATPHGPPLTAQLHAHARGFTKWSSVWAPADHLQRWHRQPRMYKQTYESLYEPNGSAF